MKWMLLLLSASLGAAAPEAPLVSDDKSYPTPASSTAEAANEAIATPEATPTEAPTPDSSNLALLQRIEELEKKQAALVKIEGYAQIRYDNQRYKAAAFTAPENGPSAVGTAFNSQGGAYVKRFEIKLSGKLLEGVDWVGGYGFEEGKLKDVGVIWKKLPLIPGFAKKGYTVELALGQFRQKFGIEPGVGSAKIPFIERALMYGGGHPLGGLSLKMVGERALGAHATHAHDYGAFGYDMGFSYMGEVTDQAKESNSLALAFPLETTNGRPSYSGRFGMSLKGLYPKSGALRVGVSGLRDDMSLITNAAASEAYAETGGLDFSFEPLKNWIWLQGEWISRLEYAAAPGLRYNAFYAAGGIRVPSVPAFWGAGFELSGRYERATWRTPGFPQYVTASTLQARFNYGKGSHTAFGMTFYAPEDHYEEAKDLAFYSIQQQFSY